MALVSIRTAEGVKFRTEKLKPRTLALLKTDINKKEFGLKNHLFSKKMVFLLSFA